MNADFDNCPHCGQKILKGAMKCVGCGKILKTPEEQKASIDRFMESKKKFNTAGLIKFIIFLLAIGVFYYFFSDRINIFIKNLLNKL